MGGGGEGRGGGVNSHWKLTAHTIFFSSNQAISLDT